jgi:hypothetical protein
MNKIKYLKEDKIKLNDVTYKPYKFGCFEFNEREGISEWFNHKGYTYIKK